MLGGDSADRLDLFVDIKPRPGLEFVEYIALVDRVLCFAGQILWAHFSIPPGDRTPIAHFLEIEEAMYRYLEGFTNNVVDGHL